MRLPLADGQGNFGSVDGDSPAAMRYTEVRLAEAAMPLLLDLDKNTVDFQANYDGSEREPVVLPARYPNLLVNGAGGIAVGMATNIPPHNLGEICDAVFAYMDDPLISLDDLMLIVPGPDFPTGGIILGRAGIRTAYQSDEGDVRGGRGSVIMRAKVLIEETRKDRQALIVTEIPYQLNKTTLIEKIAELVREKACRGHLGTARRVRSRRNAHRDRVEARRRGRCRAEPALALLATAVELWLQYDCAERRAARLTGPQGFSESLRRFPRGGRHQRTKFLLGKARDSAHVQVGLAIAVANIDEVIRLIRTSPDAASARVALMERAWPARDMAPLVALIADPRHSLDAEGNCRLSEAQARAILELRLSRLTALGRDEIAAELNRLAAEIAEYLDILRSRARVLAIIRDELEAVKKAHATPRRTEIVESDADLDDEDLIQNEEMVVTVSHAGYVKRVPLAAYRAQRRGGKGRAGMDTREEDFVQRLFVASTHQPVLFFSSLGQVYKMKVWKLPLAAPQARGKALINMLPLDPGERITTIMPMPEDSATWDTLDVMFATTRGTVRRNKLSDFSEVRRNGMIAMKLDEGEAIVDVQICTSEDDVLLTTSGGQCIRFPVDEVRVFQSRHSMGVRGINLADGHRVISLSILRHFEAEGDERTAYLKMRRAVAGESEATADAEENEENAGSGSLSSERYAAMSAAEQIILTISENGYGKRTSSFEYRITGRGGKGIVAMAVNERNGPLVASFPVDHGDGIMLVTNGGQLIRCPVDGIRVAGRTTQGVIVFNTAKGERVVSVERIDEEESVVEESGPDEAPGAADNPPQE